MPINNIPITEEERLGSTSDWSVANELAGGCCDVGIHRWGSSNGMGVGVENAREVMSKPKSTKPFKLGPPMAFSSRVTVDPANCQHAKPPLVFKAWANRWQGKVGHSVYWTRDEARLAAGPGSKPVRVRVEVTEI